MSDLLNQALSRCIDDWLEKALLPLGIAAAGLPPETTFEDLMLMDIPEVRSGPYGCGDAIAEIRCAEHFLFGSLILAAKMAGTRRAEQIRDCIQGLIWRDAVTLGAAISYFQDLAASECIDDEAWGRQTRAEEKWAPWEATEGPARLAMDAFLSDYCETQFLYQYKQ